MRASFVYRCFGCGMEDICGDCIPMYCPECDKKIRETHGNIPSSFFTPRYGQYCPCLDCVNRRNTESIASKLAIHLTEVYAAVNAYRRAVQEESGQAIALAELFALVPEEGKQSGE